MALTDSFWITYSDYIIGLPTFVLASILAYWIYSKQKTQKRIGYNVFTNSRLIEIHGKYENRFKIYFDNVEVDNLSVIFIWFKNNGTEPLEAKDFYTPVFIKFLEKTNILLAEIISKKLEDLELSVEVNNSEVALKPILLNPKEAFLVKLIVDTANTNVLITGRISGVYQIEKGIKVEDNDPKLSSFRKIQKTLIVIVTIIFLSYFYDLISSNKSIKNNTFELVIFLLMVVVWSFELTQLNKRKYE